MGDQERPRPWKVPITPAAPNSISMALGCCNSLPWAGRRPACSAVAVFALVLESVEIKTDGLNVALRVDDLTDLTRLTLVGGIKATR